jgi:hypothetical protein
MEHVCVSGGIWKCWWGSQFMNSSTLLGYVVPAGGAGIELLGLGGAVNGVIFAALAFTFTALVAGSFAAATAGATCTAGVVALASTPAGSAASSGAAGSAGAAAGIAVAVAEMAVSTAAFPAAFAAAFAFAFAFTLASLLLPFGGFGSVAMRRPGLGNGCLVEFFRGGVEAEGVARFVGVLTLAIVHLL